MNWTLIKEAFFTMKNLKKLQQEWYEENAPLGTALGYPQCCIKAFCDQPPQLLRIAKFTKDDKCRYEASCINGRFTGFIPCADHAKKILMGKITLESLLHNRSSEFPPFPFYGNFEEPKTE